ncbi:MAG: GNAT family N-acetyltransferase [Ginsengibacter sp.]
MITIEKAGIKDIKIVQDLARKVWPIAYGKILSADQLTFMLDKFYSSESLEEQMIVLNHRFIIAIENSIPVGFASYGQHANDHKVFHLNKLYVDTEMQGKNIGKKLLDHLTLEIKNEGSTSLQLNVNRFNNAVAFYKKQGFTILREDDIDIGNGYFMNDYVMGKEL